MKTIAIIYNASSGISGLISNIHKIVSPKTYSCSLCKLTHGAFTQKKQWKAFTESLHNIDFSIYHKNEWENIHGSIETPAIYDIEEKKLLLSAKEIDQCTDLEALIIKIQSQLS